LLSFHRLDELIATPDVPPRETLATVEDNIKELKRQHQMDLELFSAFQSAEYHQEVCDRYSCIDDSITGVDMEDQIQVDYLAALNVRYHCFAALKWAWLMVFHRRCTATHDLCSVSSTM